MKKLRRQVKEKDGEIAWLKGRPGQNPGEEKTRTAEEL